MKSKKDREEPLYISVVAITDMIVKCALFGCMTYAAVCFDNWKIMLLCLFGLLFNHSYRITHNDVETEM